MFDISQLCLSQQYTTSQMDTLFKLFSRDTQAKVKTLLTIVSSLLVTFAVRSYAQTAKTEYIPIHDFNTTPVIEWTFKTNASIFSSPVTDGKTVYVGSLDSVFYAIDLSTGKELWRFATGCEIRSNACINETTIYLNGGDGNLYALNKGTGAVLWKFRTRGEHKYDFADYFQSTPVLDNNTIYFGSGDSSFYAINAETGLLKWQFKTGNIVHSKAALSNGKIFFGSFDGNVYALEAGSGKLIWKFRTVGHRYFPSGEVQGSPFVFNGLVIIGARDYNVYAIDQEKGYCHWNKAFTKGWALNNTVHDSILYISSADERVLIAADPLSGKEFWKKSMEFLVFGNSAYSKNMLYLGTTIGKLHGIELSSGDKIWSFATESYQKNRSKYFKPDDTYRDDIYSIIRSNEHFLEVECELGGIFSSPLIYNDNLIFTSTNGTIYCLKRPPEKNTLDQP